LFVKTLHRFWLDPDQQRGYLHSMAILRSFILTLMIVAFLPWGAFSAKFAVPAKIGLDESQTLVAPGPFDADLPVVADRSKRCKGPSLPGSPCGPAMIATPSVDAQEYIRPPTQARYALQDHHLESVDDPAVLDPPILA